jgi:4-hydroxybenzoate polyprenyltransferase
MGPLIFDFYLRYRTAVSLAAFLLYLNTVHALLGRISPFHFLCGLSFAVLQQLTYAYDARFRTKEDVINRPGGRVVRHGTLKLVALAALPVGLLTYAGFLPMLIYAAAAVWFYSERTVFGRRFKTVPGLKTLVNVVNFWLIGILAPALFVHGLSFELVLGLIRGSPQPIIFIFCLNVLVDVRDTEGDRKAGLFTLPAVLGAPATAALLAVLLGGMGADYLYRGHFGAGAFSFALAAFSVYSFKPRGRLYYEGGLAAMNLFMAVELVRRMYFSA